MQPCWQRHRFIPVGAGNSSGDGNLLMLPPVYPRGCGELFQGSQSLVFFCGLSPWVRGTLELVQCQLNASRFIPVGAGNSSVSICMLAVEYGLSPWVRGTHVFQQKQRQVDRFIPVGAGNSQLCHPQQLPISVYPRGCGELTSQRGVTVGNCGLSPWVRGTRSAQPCQSRSTRFIPVGAGNSLTAPTTGAYQPVYPRGCGELRASASVFISSRGLSPWVRGTHFVASFRRQASRFIPVGAGNSGYLSTSKTREAVYPRGCGELYLTILKPPRLDGLSPWVRGTPVITGSCRGRQRFIPVGAGNS